MIPSNQNITATTTEFDWGLFKNLPEPKESSQDDKDLYQYFIASPYLAGFDDLKDVKRALFLDEFKKLSLNLKNFIISGETAKTIFTAAQDAGLEENKIYQTGEIIRELVLGKIFIKELPIILGAKLLLDENKASELTNKIISQSFGPILEDIKRIQRSKFPDKIAQIQKESQPTGITQPTARPIPPRPVATEVGPRNEVRPQPQPPPIRSVESIQPPRLEVPPQKPEVGLQKQPEVQLQKPAPRPQFKMPNLGPLDLARDKQPVVRESSPQATAPRPDLETRTDFKSTDAQKSLEQELEKVAGVIDLRNKPKE